ncbi:methyl-accepting chemotaxis protein [Jannaschia donghaensis]|uniref:Ribose and galactose chemoreceptor protein n=1 Tax=Jannaschia donghaensis TaxID=420998 RepID=A0A0M6YEH5_9RHOB|nr:methyl-accepting chemotaxis protein [Jannaschia donghaensis]CTQ48370.1 Ribose and galactose chemoreceptor protein [Jannaschia donghaensis]
MPDLFLAQSREKAAYLLLVTSSLCVFPVLLAAFITGTAPLPLVVLSVALSALALLIRRLDVGLGRVAIALALTGQIMLLTAAMQQHPWQLDIHMYFFVALGAIAAMVDLRALIVAAVAIILHHAILTVAMPGLVYGVSDATALALVERTALHGAAVILLAAALGATIHTRVRLVTAAAREQKATHAAKEAALAAEQRAAEALAETEMARSAAESARRDAEDALATGLEKTRRAEELDAVAAELKLREERRKAEDQARQGEAMDVLREALERLACGELQTRIAGTLPQTYEDLGDRFDTTLEILDNALREIRLVSGTITGETDDIAAAAVDLSHRTERQAATLEEITGSTEQLTKLIRATAEDAGKAEEVMVMTGTEAQTGAEVMNQAIAAMGEIEKSAGEVRKITSMIEDIAFQTNLLALNAGVEAARAGDAGRGFAVVASEVRALAQRSSEAANRINALIAQSGDQIERGVALVHDTGGALEKIIGTVETVTTRISKIAATSDEQATGVNGINAALRDLDRVSQQNATMFEETTAACQTLRTSAHGLSKAIQNFGTHDGDANDVGQAA